MKSEVMVLESSRPAFTDWAKSATGIIVLCVGSVLLMTLGAIVTCRLMTARAPVLPDLHAGSHTLIRLRYAKV
jgi:hypothetical protein